MSICKWTLVCAAAVCALAAAGCAHAQNDGRKVLTDSAQAIKSVEAMTYNVTTKGTGGLEKIIYAEGEVKFWRPRDAAAPTVYVKGRVKNPGAQNKMLEVSYDGTTVTWLDWSNLKIHSAPMENVVGRQGVTMSQEFILQQFLHSDPFAMELSWPTLRKIGIETVNGELCDIVTAGPAPDHETVWAISVADRLPRRVVQRSGGSDCTGWVTNISNLKTGVKLAASDFEIHELVGIDIMDEVVPVQSAPPPQLGLRVGEAAPDFAGKDAMNNDVTLSACKGRVVVLEFFGTMFRPSTAACAEVQAVADLMKDQRVTFIGVACREPRPDQATEFWKGNKLTYPCITQGGDDIARRYHVAGYPSVCIIGRDGTIKGFFTDNPGSEVLTNVIHSGM